MEKFKSVMRRLYRMRIKISRNGTPVLNWSVLFTGLCLLFAPHMFLIGSVAALFLGYEFNFDLDDAAFGTEEIEDTIQGAADGVRSTVNNIANAVRAGFGRENTGKRGTAGKDYIYQDMAEQAAPAPEMRKSADPVAGTDLMKPFNAAEEGLDNREVLDDLERHANDFQSNPASTSFHSAYSAMAGTVPTIQVPAEEETEKPDAGRIASGTGR